ncbi:MAG: metallophosphoesterase [Treponema sp.]|jgi:predicted MPP superfamily phosphohydrolase|nr:metallophosphoesterase [Treponema sp.]
MRWIFFAAPVFLLYAFFCFYIGIRLLGFLRCFFPFLKAGFYWPLFAVFCSLMLAAGFVRSNNLRFLNTAASLWMAVILYLLMPLVISEFVRLILFFAGKKIPNLNIYTFGAVLLTCAIFIVYGAFNVHSIKRADYNVTLNGTGAGIRVALISDLHIGSMIGKSQIKRIVDAVNSAEPDMVCITGDIFDGHIDSIKDLEGVISVLRMINAPLGVYACLGNHDIDRMSFSGNKTERIEEILKAADVILLKDESHKIREDLYIAGRKDVRPIGLNAERKTASELLGGINENSSSSFRGTIIVMEHQPVEFPQLEEAGADLVLSGHTHKGQVFPGGFITRRMFGRMGAADYGYWRGKTMQAVVTSGAGFWGPPVRIGTNSEVAVIEIKFLLGENDEIQ